MNATVRDEELNPYGGGYNPNPNQPPLYPNANGGSNPFNTNNNNNNNNNGVYNPNPNNNQNAPNYYRGRRDVGGNDSASLHHDASSNENYDEKESDSAEEDDGYDTEKETNDVGDENDNGNSSNQGKDSPLDLPQDTDHDLDSDVDILPEGRALNSNSKSARQVSPNKPGKTRRPIETGVVYTQWGSISAGRLIAGMHHDDLSMMQNF